MTIKDAENEWIMQQSSNVNSNSILNRRNSNSLSLTQQPNDVVNHEAIEFIDLNTIKSAKDLNKYTNANISNQTLDSGFVSVGNNSDYDVSSNPNRGVNSKMRLKSLDKAPSSASGLPRNVTSPSGSSLDNEDSLPQCANSKTNSRSNSAISNYSKSANNNARTSAYVNNNGLSNGTSAMPSINPNHGSVHTSSVNNSNNNNNNKKSIALNNGSNVLEENNTLFFYGIRSLEIVDLKLDANLISQITTLSFHFIDYDDFLSKSFYRIRNKFTNATVSLLDTIICFFL
jgi:hypothetical protein